MELNDAIKTLVESMRSINAKIGNSYLSLEFVLFERDDFKISTYAGKYGNTFYDRYDLSEEEFNITENSLIDGLNLERSACNRRYKNTRRPLTS